MNEFTTVSGFEDVWRPVALRSRFTPALLPLPSTRAGVRERLARVVRGAPEVMVKVTGRTRDGAHLKAHLDYISRNGAIELEDGLRARLCGRSEVADLAADWAAMAEADRRRRSSSPLSLSVVLSMPRDTDPAALRAAAQAFGDRVFGDRFERVLALHTDAGHPHVHMTVRALGWSGERLNPKKGDLHAWREAFAEALRDRGIEAEATPRRARGMSLRHQQGPVRRIEQRAAVGAGPRARVVVSAYRDAARTAFQGETALRPWEAQLAARQERTRGFYIAQARLLAASSDANDRRLAADVLRFVAAMPRPDSLRLVLTRELREANRPKDELARSNAPELPVGRGRDRSR